MSKEWITGTTDPSHLSSNSDVMIDLYNNFFKKFTPLSCISFLCFFLYSSLPI